MSTFVQGCTSQPKPELSSNTELLGIGTHGDEARDRLFDVGQHLDLLPCRQVVEGELLRGLLDAGYCNLSEESPAGTPGPSLAEKRPELGR